MDKNNFKKKILDNLEYKIEAKTKQQTVIRFLVIFILYIIVGRL